MFCPNWSKWQLSTTNMQTIATWIFSGIGESWYLSPSEWQAYGEQSPQILVDQLQIPEPCGNFKLPILTVAEPCNSQLEHMADPGHTRSCLISLRWSIWSRGWKVWCTMMPNLFVWLCQWCSPTLIGFTATWTPRVDSWGESLWILKRRTLGHHGFGCKETWWCQDFELRGSNRLKLGSDPVSGSAKSVWAIRQSQARCQMMILQSPKCNITHNITHDFAHIDTIFLQIFSPGPCDSNMLGHMWHGSLGADPPGHSGGTGAPSTAPQLR